MARIHHRSVPLHRGVLASSNSAIALTLHIPSSFSHFRTVQRIMLSDFGQGREEARAIKPTFYFFLSSTTYRAITRTTLLYNAAFSSSSFSSFSLLQIVLYPFYHRDSSHVEPRTHQLSSRLLLFFSFFHSRCYLTYSRRCSTDNGSIIRSPR